MARRGGADGILRINDRPFMWGIENWGTRDQACFAAVSAAVEFQEAVGKKRIRERGQQLAAYLRDRLADNWLGKIAYAFRARSIWIDFGFPSFRI